VSHRIGEGPWISSVHPTPFKTFSKVFENNSWKSNKHSSKYKQTTMEYGEANLQMKSACLCTQKSGSNLV